ATGKAAARRLRRSRGSRSTAMIVAAGPAAPALRAVEGSAAGAGVDPEGSGAGRLVGVRRDDPELHLGLDVRAEVDLDRVQAGLLQRPLDADVLVLDRQVVGPQGGGDHVGADGAV